MGICKDYLAAGLALGSVACILLTPALANAERHHEVRSGQTLSQIASKYHVSVASLAGANGLSREAHVREGAVLRVPQPGVIYVARGQTLGGIAQRNNVSIKALARANKIKPDEVIREGQRLVLPGHRSRARAAKRWGVPKKQGLVTLYRPATKETLKMTLLDKRGRVRPAARRRLTRLLCTRREEKTHRPHPRLLRLLSQVSDHFGGRRIIVISGYRLARGYTSDSSRHTKGRAIDFRVDGVPNRLLRDYLRKFDGVGVGYYPKSTFVHLDVRKRSAYWVDVSRPGQAPRVVRSGAWNPKKGKAKDEDVTEAVADSQPEEMLETSETEERGSQQADETEASDQDMAEADSPTPPADGEANGQDDLQRDVVGESQDAQPPSAAASLVPASSGR